MSFREVLHAGGFSVLEEAIREPAGLSPSSPAHEKLVELFTDYLFTGGMPEAVAVSAGNRSVSDAREVHRSIISTYQNDFSKYHTKISSEIILKVFNHVPLHLGEKVKYAHIVKDKPASIVREAIEALINARVLLPARHSSCTGVPLRVCSNENIFKLYFLDVGLALYQSGTKWSDLKESANYLIQKGNIAEQFTAQHLAYSSGGLEPPELYYWLREGKSTNAEVDFVINHCGTIMPIEIKAGAAGSLRSLFQFAAHSKINRVVRFDLNPPSQQQIHTSIQTAEGQKEVIRNHFVKIFLKIMKA